MCILISWSDSANICYVSVRFFLILTAFLCHIGHDPEILHTDQTDAEVFLLLLRYFLPFSCIPF